MTLCPSASNRRVFSGARAERSTNEQQHIKQKATEMATFEESLTYAQENMSTNPQSDRRRTYKEGVRVLYMRENKNKGIKKITFKLLPAFDPANPDTRTSYTPSITPDGHIAQFAAIMFSVKFAGRGDYKQRRELVSRKTEGPNATCPLSILMNFIDQNKDDWGYLTMDQGKYGTPGFVRAALPPIAPAMLANVLDMYDLGSGVRVGEFSKSAFMSLMNRKNGLMFQRNDSVPQELLAQNYMYQYSKGDLTDPNNGLVLVCERGTDKKGFSGYELSVATGPDGNPWRAQLTQDQMAQRYNMADVGSIVNIPTEQELVDELVDMLRQRSPKGYHEYALLKMAFNDYGWVVPDPPAAPAATSNISLASTPANTVTYPVNVPPQPENTNAFKPGVAAPMAATVAVEKMAEQPVAQPIPAAPIPAFVPKQQPQTAFPPSPGFAGVPGETKPLSREEIMARLRK